MKFVIPTHKSKSTNLFFLLLPFTTRKDSCGSGGKDSCGSGGGVFGSFWSVLSAVLIFCFSGLFFFFFCCFLLCFFGVFCPLKNSPNASGKGERKKGTEKERKALTAKGLERFCLIVDNFFDLTTFRHKKTAIFGGFGFLVEDYHNISFPSRIKDFKAQT